MTTAQQTTMCNKPERITSADTAQLRRAARLVAESYYGPDGIWLCDMFEAANETWFSSRLPYPLISIAITPHGKCLGQTQNSRGVVPPVITIHPTLFGVRSRGEKAPWGIDPAWLGRRYAFDVLLHEMIHVSVQYVMPTEMIVGPTSHNNNAWIAEVNRIAPLIGYEDVQAGRSVVRRVAVDGEFTKTGKPLTRPKRTSAGNVPQDVVFCFPHGLRQIRGDADAYYRAGRLPLDG